MPDAGLTDEEVEQMLSEARQEDAEDRQRYRDRRDRELAEMNALEDEVEQMVEGVRGVVDEDVLRNRRLAEIERRRQEEARRAQQPQASPFPQGAWRDNNLVDVGGRVMQVIEAGQLWQHHEEPNVQLRVVEEGDGTVTVAPVGISAQVGLPSLFLLTVEVFTREFRHRDADQRWSPQGDRDFAEDMLAHLANEKGNKEEPEDDIERRTIWERLMDEDDSL